MKDDDVKSAFRNGDRGNEPDRLMPKHDDTSGEAVGEDNRPVPKLGDFSTEAIDTIGVGSSFDEANHQGFVGVDETKNASRSFSC